MHNTELCIQLHFTVMHLVWHLTKVRSQSFTQTCVIVIAADIYMLTHCQQEKRERQREKKRALWQLCCVWKREKREEKKKLYWTWSRLSTRNRPIISEMAGEFLKCESVSLDIHRRQRINDKHINKTLEWWLFPPLPLHTIDRIVFLISKLLTQKIRLLGKRKKALGVCACLSLGVHTQIPLNTWSSDFKGLPVYHKPVLFDIWLNSITANQRSKMPGAGVTRVVDSFPYHWQAAHYKTK